MCACCLRDIHLISEYLWVAGFFHHSARLQKNGSYRTVKNPQTVFVHPSSGLAQASFTLDLCPLRFDYILDIPSIVLMQVLVLIFVLYVYLPNAAASSVGNISRISSHDKRVHASGMRSYPDLMKS